MVTKTKPAAGPLSDHQQQQTQKKFKLKNPFKKSKNKYKELHSQPGDPSHGTSGDGISSIEVLELQTIQTHPTDARVLAESLEDVGQTHSSVLGTDEWTDCSTRSNKKKKRVRFWRYSKDEALLEDEVHIEEITDNVDEVTDNTEDDRNNNNESGDKKNKAKKSKKKRAKQAGLAARQGGST